MDKIQAIIEYIENDICENNKFCNAIVCDGEYPDEIVIKFKSKDGKELFRYAQVVTKAIELGAIIKETGPANLKLTLKFCYAK